MDQAKVRLRFPGTPQRPPGCPQAEEGGGFGLCPTRKGCFTSPSSDAAQPPRERNLQGFPDLCTGARRGLSGSSREYLPPRPPPPPRPRPPPGWLAGSCGEAPDEEPAREGGTGARKGRTRKERGGEETPVRSFRALKALRENGASLAPPGRFFSGSSSTASLGRLARSSPAAPPSPHGGPSDAPLPPHNTHPQNPPRPTSPPQTPPSPSPPLGPRLTRTAPLTQCASRRGASLLPARLTRTRGRHALRLAWPGRAFPRRFTFLHPAMQRWALGHLTLHHKGLRTWQV